MLKRLCEVTLFSTILAGGFISATNADTMFDGTLKITAVNSSCTQGPPVGMTGTEKMGPGSITLAGRTEKGSEPFSKRDYKGKAREKEREKGSGSISGPAR